MLCIMNCQYTHNQGKFCQNFQFFHIYTSFSVNLHHFTVTKPKFRSKSPKFRSTKPKFRSECNEISFFEFKITFRLKLPKFRLKFRFRRMAGFGAKTKRRTLLVAAAAASSGSFVITCPVVFVAISFLCLFDWI